MKCYYTNTTSPKKDKNKWCWMKEWHVEKPGIVKKVYSSQLSLFISLFSYYSRLDSCPVTDIKWVLSHIFYTPKCDCRERGKTFSFEYFNSLNPRHIKAFVTFSTSFVLFNWFIFYLLCSFIVGLSCWFYALYNG